MSSKLKLDDSELDKKLGQLRHLQDAIFDRICEAPPKKYNELLDIIKNFTDDDELIRYLIAHFDRELFPSRDKYPRRSLREALRSHPQINKITDRVGLIPDLRRKLIYELLGAEPGDESTPLSA